MERAVQPVAAGVAGEDAAGAVAAVRRRRQADDEQARARVAEAGHRLPPIRLSGERALPLAGDLLAAAPKPWAAFACNDGALDRGERRERARRPGRTRGRDAARRGGARG